MKCNLRLIFQSLFLDFSRLLTCKVHGVVHRIYQLKQCLCYYVFRYALLLEQFSAVSYGDFLFGSFILLPLQQRFSVSLRKLVWEDHPQVLRSLAVPLEQVCEQLQHFKIIFYYCLQLPLDTTLFLYPTECDVTLVEAYLSSLASATVRYSPVEPLINRSGS